MLAATLVSPRANNAESGADALRSPSAEAAPSAKNPRREKKVRANNPFAVRDLDKYVPSGVKRDPGRVAQYAQSVAPALPEWLVTGAAGAMSPVRSEEQEQTASSQVQPSSISGSLPKKGRRSKGTAEQQQQKDCSLLSEGSAGNQIPKFGRRAGSRESELRPPAVPLNGSGKNLSWKPLQPKSNLAGRVLMDKLALGKTGNVPRLRGMPWLGGKHAAHVPGLAVKSAREGTTSHAGDEIFATRSIVSARNNGTLSKSNISRQGSMSARQPSGGPPYLSRGAARMIAASMPEVKRVRHLIRQKLSQRMQSGKAELARSFNLFDLYGHGKVDKDGLELALARFGVDIWGNTVDALMMVFDADGSGFIDFSEFVKFVYGDEVVDDKVMDGKRLPSAHPTPVNDTTNGHRTPKKSSTAKSASSSDVSKGNNLGRRVNVNQARQIIREYLLPFIPSNSPSEMRKAFAAMDSSKTGMINRQDLSRVLRSQNVHVSDALLDGLMAAFKATHEGISFKEFLRHVMLLAASELDDEWASQQERVVRQKARAGGLPARISALLREHVAARMNVMAPSNLRKLFHQFDQDGNGTISPAELKNALAGCGITLTSPECEEIVQHFDCKT